MHKKQEFTVSVALMVDWTDYTIKSIS